MKETAKAALLIDADNTQISRLDDIMRIALSYGRVVLKRAYGNWQKDSLKNWKEYLKRLAIKAEQQFDYVSGKNATDIALVVDAMSLLNMNIYDIFILSASDSDYTPLAVKLRESGSYVIGIGSKCAPKAFKNSCDEYICIEDLGCKAAAKEQQVAAAKSVSGKSDTSLEILELLKMAADKYKDESGFVYICTAGMYVKRAKPEFDIQALGYSKLTKLIEAYPEIFELQEYKRDADSRVVGYKYRVKTKAE
ncbi:MAG: NYN domain-containing protein [Clostridia bacterium]|nr:NYN domain-containing protein [Clostridia bacterium]